MAKSAAMTMPTSKPASGSPRVFAWELLGLATAAGALITSVVTVAPPPPAMSAATPLLASARYSAT